METGATRRRDERGRPRRRPARALLALAAALPGAAAAPPAAAAPHPQQPQQQQQRQRRQQQQPQPQQQRKKQRQQPQRPASKALLRGAAEPRRLGNSRMKEARGNKKKGRGGAYNPNLVAFDPNSAAYKHGSAALAAQLPDAPAGFDPCPADDPTFAGDRASHDCLSYVYCDGGKVQGAYVSCTAGLRFDNRRGVCDWAADVRCEYDADEAEGGGEEDAGWSGGSNWGGRWIDGAWYVRLSPSSRVRRIASAERGVESRRGVATSPRNCAKIALTNEREEKEVKPPDCQQVVRCIGCRDALCFRINF